MSTLILNRWQPLQILILKTILKRVINQNKKTREEIPQNETKKNQWTIKMKEHKYTALTCLLAVKFVVILLGTLDCFTEDFPFENLWFSVFIYTHCQFTGGMMVADLGITQTLHASLPLKFRVEWICFEDSTKRPNVNWWVLDYREIVLRERN